MKKITIFLLALALGTTFVSAQNIVGKVLDSQGKPLPGASVYWADTSVGIATDLEGKFSLYRVKTTTPLLQISLATQTILFASKIRCARLSFVSPKVWQLMP